MSQAGELITNLGLSYRLARPLPAQPKRLVILLHGVGSNEADMAGLAEGMADDTVVLTARGSLTLGPGQFAWFRVAFGASGPSIDATQAEHSRLALIAFVQQVQARYGIAAQDTVIAGFSQGGIMSAGVGLSAPGLVAGFGLLSGRILPELAPHLAPREQLAKLQAFVGHGEQDNTLPVAWAHRSDAWLTELGVPHQFKLYRMGHSVGPSIHADFLNWLATLR
jgi:phospholipase/carboxylesterase